MKGDDESSVKTQALTDVVDATGDTRYTQHYSDFVIDYDDGSFWFNYPDKKRWIMSAYDFEVIGNIYENPELLK